MKLKPLISKLICFQKYRILLFFLVGIAVLTVVSRAADSFMIPTMMCILVLLTVFRKPIEQAGGLL